MKLNLNKKEVVKYEGNEINFSFKTLSAEDYLKIQTIQSENEKNNIEVILQVVESFLVSCDLVLEDESGDIFFEKEKSKWVRSLPFQLVNAIFNKILGVVKEEEEKK